MNNQEWPQKKRPGLLVKAFISGVVFTVACRLSDEAMDWWSGLNPSFNNYIMLAAPIAALVFLLVIWMSQQTLRYYFGDRSFDFTERHLPIKVSGFLAFLLGYFMTSFFLSVLAGLF